MNHRHLGRDRYCYECKTIKLTDGFRSLPGMKRREICADCFAHRMAQSTGERQQSSKPEASLSTEKRLPHESMTFPPDIENTVKTKRLM
jgi:hypothetical protein